LHRQTRACQPLPYNEIVNLMIRIQFRILLRIPKIPLIFEFQTTHDAYH
jgi:hypothetical protein